MNRKDANGTMLRLRSMMAMGHSAPRLARFLGEPVRVVQRLVSGEAATVDVELERAARALFDQLWKYRPPERNRYERAAAERSRDRARAGNWCAPLGLDEDLLDEPGYRPAVGYRPAIGVGVAPDLPRAS